MIGTRFGPYEIVEEIGQGGMATVYQAYQPNMDRFVALKVIRPSTMSEETIRERFQREARLIARLEHPHILPVYDFDGTHDPPYIVMRFLEGGTLKDLIVSRRLPLDEIGYLLRQVSLALDYAHRQGVVHRDIKPSNIMIDLEGNAFIMDFGIARLAKPQSLAGDITGAGATLGTPDYMAPEQIMGGDLVGVQADVYSLGVTVFQLVTGQLPFVSDVPAVTMLMHLKDAPPIASGLNPELNQESDAAFRRALAKDPAERFQSVGDFMNSLLPVLGGSVSTRPTQLRHAAEAWAVQQRRARERGATVIYRAGAQAIPTERNKSVTAVFANAAEFSEIIDSSQGPEMARQAVTDLWEEIANQVVGYGGVVYNRNDRDMLALWGSEVVREDDAERAVGAALAIRDLVAERTSGILNPEEPLPVRIGVNTGLALLTFSAGTGTQSASGATVSVASRVADNADGLVLVTHDTFRQVQGVFEIEPDVPVRARRLSGRVMIDTYRVLAPKPRAFRVQPRIIEGVDTRMIGRKAEYEQLIKAYFNAVEESETQMVTVIGWAGMGKSRLLYEFATWAELRPEMYFIFRSRATPSMTNRPYALWRDLLSFRFEIRDSDNPDVVQEKMESGVSHLIGANEVVAHLMGYLAGFNFIASPHLTGESHELAERARAAVRDFYHRLTMVDPVVFQLDDLHHADEATLDLLLEIVSSNPNMRMLVVGMARPSLYDRRPVWGSGQHFHTRIELKALDKRDSRVLVAEILQRVKNLPRNLRDLIVDQAEGNPFYMEELVKMLLEDRVIQKLKKERWGVESSRLERLRVPQTLVGLLQARFDSLLYPEKLTLQRAAVVGRVFYDKAVVELDAADENHINNLQQVLAKLVEREFIYPRETSAFAGCREFIFGQGMMRDLILETLLRRQSRVYNRAMGQWLAAQGGERAGEYDALIAEYYENAGETAKAIEYLGRASNAAVARGALDEGIRLLERAIEQLDEQETDQRLTMELTLGANYGWKGEYEKAWGLLEPLLPLARKLGNRRSEANALAQLGRIAGTWLGRYDAGRQYLEKALPIARDLDDRPLLIFILRQLGNLAYVTGVHAKARVQLEESLALAREQEDLHSACNALNSLGESARHQGDRKQALSCYDEALAIAGEMQFLHLIALLTTNKASVYLEQGNYDLAHKTGQEAQAAARAIGTEYLIAAGLQTLGGAALGLGDNDKANEYLEAARKKLIAMGNMPELLYGIPDWARLRARSGDRVGGLKWVGMALAHPSLSSVGRLRNETARDELSQGLQDEEAEAILNQGAGLDIVTELGNISPWLHTSTSNL